MLSEECYADTRSKFLAHIAFNKGPHNITLSLVLSVFDMDRWTFDPLNTAYDIRERLIVEFCPFKLEVDDAIRVIDNIKEIDDNTNFIYSLITEKRRYHYNEMDWPSNHEKTVRVLCLSNENLSSMLRLAYGFKNGN